MIPIELINLAAEATSPYNDGYSAAGYREQLEQIRDYIDKVLRNNK
jgi:hypothetical protein